MCVMHAFFVVGAIRVGRKLETGVVFLFRWDVMYMDVRYAGFAGAKTCPWPVPRSILGR